MERKIRADKNLWMFVINLLIPMAYCVLLTRLYMEKLPISIRTSLRDYFAFFVIAQLIISILSFFYFKGTIHRVFIILILVLLIALMHITTGDFNPY